MKPIKDLPTNIITGFLGTGKTTTINHLLSQKPADERWAVLVNEFGQIGVDEAQMTQQGDINIKELPGGCFCCTMGPALPSTLATLIRTTRPDRLLIEPTGLGHLPGIIQTLTTEPFKEVISLQATLCLVDPRNLTDPEVVQLPAFVDQIQLADVLIINKSDLAAPALLARMEQEARGLYPPKQAVLSTRNGEVDLSLLDMPKIPEDAASHAEHHHNHEHDHHHEHDHPHADGQEEAGTPEPGKPVRLAGSDGTYHSCGWLFHESSQFDPTAIFELLQNWPDLARAKGVFRIGDMHIAINRSKDECYSQPTSYCRDSRIELISSIEQDWSAFEQQLMGCLRP